MYAGADSQGLFRTINQMKSLQHGTLNRGFRSLTVINSPVSKVTLDTVEIVAREMKTGCVSKPI